MRKGTFIKGIMTGVLVGTAVSLAINPIDQKRMRALKRDMGRAARKMGDRLDSLTH